MRSVKLSLLAVAVIGAQAIAQTPGIDTSGTVGYVIDQRANVAKSGFGLCWRTGYWTPAMAIPECDADLAKKAAATPAQAAKAAPAVAAKRCDFTSVLGADATFKFNKADLTPAAKAQLDGVLGRLGACAKVDAVTVTGHSDRLGSEKYNNALSAKRAEAVKAYLAGKGVSGVVAQGAGESQPLADVKCDAKMSRAKQIACLAPNRRVVIEVMGTAR
jgi:OOP family OmpA-OmpF porin